MRALAGQRELHDRVLQYHRDFEKEKEDRYTPQTILFVNSFRLDITADMTRQYKAMQEQLIDRVNKLENQNAELRDQLGKCSRDARASIRDMTNCDALAELSRAAYEELRKEKESSLNLKDAEISELRQKMEEMSQEFADMLRETLDKMSEKVEKSSSKWETESKIPGKERLNQFHLGHVEL